MNARRLRVTSLLVTVMVACVAPTATPAITPASTQTAQPGATPTFTPTRATQTSTLTVPLSSTLQLSSTPTVFLDQVEVNLAKIYNSPVEEWYMLSTKGGEKFEISFHFSINGVEVVKSIYVYPDYGYAFMKVDLKCEKQSVSGYVEIRVENRSVEKLSNPRQLELGKKIGCPGATPSDGL